MIIDDRELHGARRRAKETDDFFRYNDFSHTHAYTRTLVGALNQALVGDEVRLLGAGLARHGCECSRKKIVRARVQDWAGILLLCLTLYSLMARWLS